MTLGRPHVHHRATDSTNERARELATAGAPHGTLVTAAEQSAGRGRQGRAWVAPAGSALLMSLVVRDLGERTMLLPLAAAVAVCEAAEAGAPVACRIKWPNDVWIDGRKLAGILVEGRPQEGWAVLGMGINVTTESFPGELDGTATSLRMAAPRDAPRDAMELVSPLLAALESCLAGGREAILSAWRERDALHGSAVRWRDGEGTAAGISESGALVVQTAAGSVELDAGEVHLLR